MRDVILPRLQGDDKEDRIEELLKVQNFGNKTRFTGTIHCEATLMALVHSFSSAAPSAIVPPFSDQETGDLKPVFRVSI